MKEQTPLISREAAEEFTQNLSQIMGGGYQQILWADKQGIPAALGLELPEWVRRIGGYIKYSLQERRKIVEELHAGGLASAKISELLGTSYGTIRRDMTIKGLPRKPHKRKAKNSPNGEYAPAVTPGAEEENSSNHSESEGTSTQILDWATQEGLESLIWQKVKDRVIPFFEDLVEAVDEDEADHLLLTIYHQLGRHEIAKKDRN